MMSLLPQCHVINKNGNRCMRYTSLVSSNDMEFVKHEHHNRIFKQGEYWELFDGENWRPSCRIHFNINYNSTKIIKFY